MSEDNQEPNYKTKSGQALYKRVMALEDKGYPIMGSQGISDNSIHFFNQAIEYNGIPILTRASLAQSVILNAAEDGRDVTELLQRFDEFCITHSIDDKVYDQKKD